MTLRQQLAEAKAFLRRTKDDYDTITAIAEDRAIKAGCTGKNEEERKRNLRIALANDGNWGNAREELRDAEADVARIEADVAEEEHALRLREVAARERLAEALLGKRVDDAVTDRIAFEAGRVAGRQVAHEMRRQGGAVFDEVAFEEARTKRIDDLYPPQPADYTKDGGHKWLVHHNCENPYCNICEGGLAQCTVCGAAECELPSECPGVRMTPEQREAVCAGTLDYQAGQWIGMTPSESTNYTKVDSIDWYKER